ncbi:hypothetical protein F442_10309 [Phytophthora nicotianae P10297]|uniref:Uncharacterized protein n=1 Tax=Phytophthora nicotianae P10297 TaxID=1317064 RepID=W2Z6B2_PHYNI|nr:hypothetical protein F442_10309 [Phytophthora nicotianae P10297]
MGDMQKMDGVNLSLCLPVLTRVRNSEVHMAIPSQMRP